MKKIRIVHILGVLNRGGAESMIMTIFRNIDRTKFQFDFIVHTDIEGAFEEEIKELGGNIMRVPKYSGLNHLGYSRALSSLFGSFEKDTIIHSHIRSTATIIIQQAKRKSLKVIVHSHSISSGQGFSAMVKNYYQKNIDSRADFKFACTEAAGKWLFNKDFPSKKNEMIIYNAIDHKNFIFDSKKRDKIREIHQIGADDFVIGCIARFHPQKNHLFLLKFFKKIQLEYPLLRLVLVGEGHMRAEIEEIIERNQIENVILTGEVNNPSDYYNAMDIFVLPSKSEGLGIVYVEAQFNGLPTIASNNVPTEVDIEFDLISFLALNEELWKNKIVQKIKDFENSNLSNRNISNFNGTSSKYMIEKNIEIVEEIYTGIWETDS